MQYDYNSKKSATATVKLPSNAPWNTTQVLLGGTATTPDKDITGLKAVRAPAKTLGSAVDAASGVRVNQVINRPALSRASSEYPAGLQPIYGLPGMGQVPAPIPRRPLFGLPGMGDIFVSQNSTMLLLAAVGAAWYLTKGR